MSQSVQIRKAPTCEGAFSVLNATITKPYFPAAALGASAFFIVLNLLYIFFLTAFFGAFFSALASTFAAVADFAFASVFTATGLSCPLQLLRRTVEISFKKILSGQFYPHLIHPNPSIRNVIHIIKAM